MVVLGQICFKLMANYENNICVLFVCLMWYSRIRCIIITLAMLKKVLYVTHQRMSILKIRTTETYAK